MLKNGELELINKYTRRPFSEEEVFVFSLVLCDNEIDRDNERFSENALEKLRELFTGVTGVMNHDPRAENQTARIFSCRIERPPEKFTSDNRQYVSLNARAYMPKAACCADLITMIDSGIKKEVSVGCSVSKKICSVCGKDQRQCGHIKGKYYDGVMCYAVLDEPTDAYEWSFVAVPAQKAAGVTKNYKIKGEKKMDIEKRLFSGQEQSFTADEMNAIAEKFRSLSERAADGDTYRRKLEKDISKMAAFVLPNLSRETLNYVVSKMNAVQLEDMCSALTKKASEEMPLSPQLKSSAAAVRHNNNDYKNI